MAGPTVEATRLAKVPLASLREKDSVLPRRDMRSQSSTGSMAPATRHLSECLVTGLTLAGSSICVALRAAIWLMKPFKASLPLKLPPCSALKAGSVRAEITSSESKYSRLYVYGVVSNGQGTLGAHG